MLGVAGYGSDSDSGNETEATPNLPASSLGRHPPVPAQKSTAPSNATASTSTSFSLPPPKVKKAPKKIAIGLPALPKEADGDASDSDDRPIAKKPRLESGSGTSALLSMLPAPRNKAPVRPQQERVLGGGRGSGLVFRAARHEPSRTVTIEDAEDAEDVTPQGDVLSASHSTILEEKAENTPSLPFVPTSVTRGKANLSVEETHVRPVSRPTVPSAPAVDFFSLSSASSSRASSSTLVTSVPSFTAAPKIDDFTPPEPTQDDPYPGYYLLPGGQWAAYDPAYYRKFYKKEYDDHVRALEKGKIKGFEGAEEEAQEVNALKEMERARKGLQEREERKALTTAAADVPDAPKMNIKGAALGGRARTRHQLSTLLTEAYQNREALEERIAQGRKNRKEAGNKYGF